MALTLVSSHNSAGGIKRGTVIFKKSDSTSVVPAAASIGTLADPSANNKNVVARVRALDGNLAESAAYVDVMGRAIADGAGVWTIYVWCADTGITVSANHHFVIDWELHESVLSD